MPSVNPDMTQRAIPEIIPVWTLVNDSSTPSIESTYPKRKIENYAFALAQLRSGPPRANISITLKP